MARSSIQKVNPRGLSADEYMQWHAKMRETFGDQVFELCGIVIPKDFETMTPGEQERLHDDNKNKLYLFQEKNRSIDEASIEELGADFVSEEDWAFLSGRKTFSPKAVTFKSFKGRNYELEYVRSEEDVHFHLFLQIGTKEHPPVYTEFERILLKIIPRHWRVHFNFTRGVIPQRKVPAGKEMRDRFDLNNAYGICFKQATTFPGCHVILESALRAILKEFIMPVHEKEGLDLQQYFQGA